MKHNANEFEMLTIMKHTIFSEEPFIDDLTKQAALIRQSRPHTRKLTLPTSNLSRSGSAYLLNEAV
jgi:hypothetical protein